MIDYDIDFVGDFIDRHNLHRISRYAVYHALDWAENKSVGAIRDEVARLRAKFSHNYQWNEVGNRTLDYARETILAFVLKERGIPCSS